MDDGTGKGSGLTGSEQLQGFLHHAGGPRQRQVEVRCSHSTCSHGNAHGHRSQLARQVSNSTAMHTADRSDPTSMKVFFVCFFVVFFYLQSDI